MSPRSTQEEHIAKLKKQLADATAKIEAKKQAAIAKLDEQIAGRTNRIEEREVNFKTRERQSKATHQEWVTKQKEELADLIAQRAELADPSPVDDESSEAAEATADDNTVA